MSLTRLIAGAMSGTSADGVDVAITRIEGVGLGMSSCVVLHHHRPYDAGVRSEIFALRSSGIGSLRALAELARHISLVYAAAVKEALAAAHLTATDLAAVAAHGQTLFHAPPLTLQWLDPALLAAEVGCPVISDFRRADCAAGGQGAPLVPFADYILFRHVNKHRVLLNIGGIANLTFLPASATLDQVIAFDTGPGNCVSDWLIRQLEPSGPGYDVGGALALRGRVLPGVAERARRHPYFVQPPPKSTDGPEMIEAFRAALDRPQDQFAHEDLLATACYLTALGIADAVATLPTPPNELVISGGGTRNAALMRFLHQLLPHAHILTTDNLGIPQAAKEALAFALLGAATLDNLPSNVPSATGANRAVVLGSITPYQNALATSSQGSR
jgi:anhydro-N-acetylmuramic acid kinase